jgi:hypothetical protein
VEKVTLMVGWILTGCWSLAFREGVRMEIEKKGYDSSANASKFGWDFQVIAALFLFVKNLEEIKSIEVEGSKEDIEIQYLDNQKTYIQAKAKQENPFESTGGADKFSAGLKTLINVSTKVESFKSLVYLSNMPNPFSDAGIKGILNKSMYSEVDFEDLPKPTQKKILGKIEKVQKDNHQLDSNTFDVRRFKIAYFPFYGGESSRYREIYYEVKNFLSSIKVSEGRTHEIVNEWVRIFHDNSSSKNTKISRNEILWPVIVVETNSVGIDRFSDILDQDYFGLEEIILEYSQLIESRSEKFSVMNKILVGLSEFVEKSQQRIDTTQVSNFINSYWEDYKDIILFQSNEIQHDDAEILVKLTMWKVISRRRLFGIMKEKGYIDVD